MPHGILPCVDSPLSHDPGRRAGNSVERARCRAAMSLPGLSLSPEGGGAPNPRIVARSSRNEPFGGLLRVGAVGGDERDRSDDVIVKLVELLGRNPELVDAGA